MPKIIKNQEVLLFQGISLNDIIKEEFLKKIQDKKLDIEPISLVLIACEQNEKSKKMFPIIISHESKEEIKSRMLHINLEKSKISDDFMKVLEEIEKK